jgi:hypothetical protein
MRRVRSLRRFPETGFVIFNPKAEEGLNFYCKTKSTKTKRITVWAERADTANVYDNIKTAKGAASKLRNRSEEFDQLQVITIESQMQDAFEIDSETCEVRKCKAWSIEIEINAAFKTKVDALNFEKEYKMKERANLILRTQENSKKIDEIEKEIQKENLAKESLCLEQ